MRAIFPYVSWHANWHDLLKMVDKCSHDINIIPVLWSKLPGNWVKLNFDGSALCNGRIGDGGIIRNSNREFLQAYSTPLCVGSNNQAKVEAALFGGSWCL